MILPNQPLRYQTSSFRALALGYLTALALAYAYAIFNIALVVGLTPKEIAIHYYGSENRIEIDTVPAESGTSTPGGEQEFSLDEVPEATSNVTITRPSLKNLVAEGHFHLFGMSSFFFGLTLLGLFVQIKESFKVLLVITPFFAVIVDNVSFMATRFLGPAFAFLTAGAGTLMFVCFSSLWILIAKELWLGRKLKNK